MCVQSIGSLWLASRGRVRVRAFRLSQGFKAGQRGREPAYLGHVANLRG